MGLFTDLLCSITEFGVLSRVFGLIINRKRYDNGNHNVYRDGGYDGCHGCGCNSYP